MASIFTHWDKLSINLWVYFGNLKNFCYGFFFSIWVEFFIIFDNLICKTQKTKFDFDFNRVTSDVKLILQKKDRRISKILSVNDASRASACLPDFLYLVKNFDSILLGITNFCDKHIIGGKYRNSRASNRAHPPCVCHVAILHKTK